MMDCAKAFMRDMRVSGIDLTGEMVFSAAYQCCKEAFIIVK